MNLRALIFLFVASQLFQCFSEAQTLSGYRDVAGTNSFNETYFKTKPIEFPGAPVDGLQVILRLATNRFQLTNQIKCAIVVKNVSSNNLWFSFAWPLLANGIEFQILDQNKKKVPLSESGKIRVSSESASPNVGFTLPPGNEKAVPLNLSEFYQLTAPGAYTLQTFVSIPASGKRGNWRACSGITTIILQEDACDPH